MKMMPWSRYHCWPKPLLHAERRYRAARSLRTRQRIRAIGAKLPAGLRPGISNL
jgi:hypothetical protein